jgi:hypothetical protein
MAIRNFAISSPSALSILSIGDNNSTSHLMVEGQVSDYEMTPKTTPFQHHDSMITLLSFLAKEYSDRGESPMDDNYPVSEVNCKCGLL